MRNQFFMSNPEGKKIIRPVFLNIFFPWRNPYNNGSYPKNALPKKTKKKKYEETVVSARRLLQYFQLPEKNSRHAFEIYL
jgi:hypothetical protein